MPGFDGTGPEGTGPMTGGGRGFCHASAAGGRKHFPHSGRGYRHWFHATGLPGRLSAGDEKEALQQEAEHLKRRLENIRDRLQKLPSPEEK